MSSVYSGLPPPPPPPRGATECEGCGSGVPSGGEGQAAATAQSGMQGISVHVVCRYLTGGILPVAGVGGEHARCGESRVLLCSGCGTPDDDHSWGQSSVLGAHREQPTGPGGMS